jgi:hypothetical protein
MNLPYVIVVTLTEFENNELLDVKKTRTRQEYCWTCTASLIYFLIKKYNLDECTYLDADLLFFDDPKIILDEMKEDSVLLTKHLMADGSKKTEQVGRYCVQFMPFKNDVRGMTALSWWKDKTIEWCYARIENGKFGDQKYLDDWTERFSGVHVMEHIGGGVASWNMFRYRIENKNDKFYIGEKNKTRVYPLIFFHFHSTKIFNFGGKIISSFWPYDYNLNKSAGKLYSHYSQKISETLSSIKKIDPDFYFGFVNNKYYFYYLYRMIIVNINMLVRQIVKTILQKNTK